MTAVETNVNFREHDIEFLQSRTKLWLQAVLGETFDDKRSLAQLLADGNLLYRVAKYVIKDTTGRSPGPELLSPKVFAEAATQAKNSGRYLPYSNVDTFLKMCRQVGLSDVDLFTPPDAVEGKDIRRVCLAIRSLAKKGRSQHIRLPDFDDVSRPLPMPKEKVGEIREHLQHASSSPTASTVYSPDVVDIQKSERIQIINRFLSSTKSPSKGSPLNDTLTPNSAVLGREASDDLSPVTPQRENRSFVNLLDSPATPAATLEGLSSPSLRKSLSEGELTGLSGNVNARFKTSSPQLTPLAKPEWVLDDELALDQGLKSSEEVTESEKWGVSVEADSVPSEELSAGKAFGRPPRPTIKPRAAELQVPVPNGQTDSPCSEEEFEALLAKVSTPAKASVNEDHASQTEEKSDGTSGSKDERSFTPESPLGDLPSPQKESRNRSKPIQININLRIWGPVIAGAVAFFGTLLAVRPRESPTYEVKQGDTLSKISKTKGRYNWEELVRLNPNIKNPDLIYPSERLRLPV